MARPLRILILEDNPTDAELIEFELAEAGFDFSPTLVRNETEFVSAIKGSAPDIILSDYDLPRYNGASALAEAKRSCPDTPFILVTGAVSEDRAIEILTQGAQDYVLKNRLQKRLAPAVRRAIAEAEKRRARQKAEADLREAHRILVETEKTATGKMKQALREVRSRECARIAALRGRVEGRAEPDATAPADLGIYTQRFVQELQIHRVELEATNEELTRARDEAEALLARQLDFYDIAPVGYFTLDPDGTILQVNLTGADLLGVVRSTLTGRKLRFQIASADLPAFDRIFSPADAGKAGNVTEVGILRPGGDARFVQLKARWSENRKECYVSMMDVTDRRRAEAALEERTRQLEEARRELDRLTPRGGLPEPKRS